MILELQNHVSWKHFYNSQVEFIHSVGWKSYLKQLPLNNNNKTTTATKSSCLNRLREKSNTMDSQPRFLHLKSSMKTVTGISVWYLKNFKKFKENIKSNYELATQETFLCFRLRFYQHSGKNLVYKTTH